MLRGSTGLCYDQSALGTSEFVSLTSKSPTQQRYRELSTMFALTDDVTSPSFHETCFGQDIASYSEIVTIMVRLYFADSMKKIIKVLLLIFYFYSSL